MTQRKRILVVAPHADDETLGMGGTIARYCSEGHSVRVAIVTGQGNDPHPIWKSETWEKVRTEARAAMKHLGDPELVFYELPAVVFADGPIYQTNGIIDNVIREFDPDELYIPYYHDLHRDHLSVSYACLVAARSYTARGKNINVLAMYETPTETHLLPGSIAPSFSPNLYVSIDGFVDAKLSAWAEYVSQHQDGITPRSPAALSALARLRGADIGQSAAEAFMLVKWRR
jgi:N-acetylglucosamine malate deacetylase 1